MALVADIAVVGEHIKGLGEKLQSILNPYILPTIHF
jgi:hypothetical protein